MSNAEQLKTIAEVTSLEAVKQVLDKLGFRQDQHRDQVTAPVWRMLINYENQGYIAQKDYGEIFQKFSGALDEVFPYPQLNDHDGTLRVEGVTAVMQQAVNQVWELEFPNSQKSAPDLKMEAAKVQAEREEQGVLLEGKPVAADSGLKKVVMVPQDQLEQVVTGAHNITSSGIKECAFFFPNNIAKNQFEAALKTKDINPSSRLYGMHNNRMLERTAGGVEIEVANYSAYDLMNGKLAEAGYQAIPVSALNADGTAKKPEALVKEVRDTLKQTMLGNQGLEQRASALKK